MLNSTKKVYHVIYSFNFYVEKNAISVPQLLFQCYIYCDKTI